MVLMLLLKDLKEFKNESKTYSNKCKGKIVDYRRIRHTLDENKERRLMYHPIIRYHKNGDVHECVSETGYTKEYYKVGMYTVIYWDTNNPNRIKTRKERKSRLNAVFYFALLCVLLLFILGLIVL